MLKAGFNITGDQRAIQTIYFPRKICSKEDWDDLIDYLLYIYNSNAR